MREYEKATVAKNFPMVYIIKYPEGKMKKLGLCRFDFAAYAAFTTYSISSFAIPMVLVQLGRELAFPLENGGMAAGGGLHLLRSCAMLFTLLGCGVIIRKIGKRRSMIFSLSMMGLGILSCAFSNAYWMLLPGLALAGLGEGICEGAATPFVQSLHPTKPERYVNVAHSFWSVGIGICVLGAGALLSCGVSWRIILGASGMLTILSTLLFWGKGYPEETADPAGGGVWSDTVKILHCSRFWLYCAGMFFGAGAEFCLTFWAASFLQLHFHSGVWLAGVGTAVIALGMFCGRVAFGVIAREENLKWILLGASLGTIPLTLALAPIALIDQEIVRYLVLFMVLFACGIGIAPYWPTLQVYGVRRLPHLDETLLYVYFSAVGIPGCGFFTWIVGKSGDRFGLAGAFYLIPVTLLIYAAIIFLDAWCLGAPRQKTATR